jgi:hypothetical protein
MWLSWRREGSNEEASRLSGMPTPGWAGRARTVFQQLRLVAEAIADVRNLFLNAKPLPHPPDRGTYLVEKAPPAEVVLHAEAVSLLQSASGVQATGLVGVWLENTEAGIAVYAEGGQVGVLRDEDVPAYLPIMRAAQQKGAVAVMPAVLSEEPGRHPRLRLGVSLK